MGLLAFLLLGFLFYRCGNPDTLKGRCVEGSSRICVHAATSLPVPTAVCCQTESPSGYHSRVQSHRRMCFLTH